MDIRNIKGFAYPTSANAFAEYPWIRLEEYHCVTSCDAKQYVSALLGSGLKDDADSVISEITLHRWITIAAQSLFFILHAPYMLCCYAAHVSLNIRRTIYATFHIFSQLKRE